jgi:hypothetical protein
MMDGDPTEAEYRPGGPIVLVLHNPEWSSHFARESADVAGALGEVLVGIHHIGRRRVIRSGSRGRTPARLTRTPLVAPRDEAHQKCVSHYGGDSIESAATRHVWHSAVRAG